MYVYLYTCILVYTYIRLCVYKYTCIHVYMYIWLRPGEPAAPPNGIPQALSFSVESFVVCLRPSPTQHCAPVLVSKVFEQRAFRGGRSHAPGGITFAETSSCLRAIELMVSANPLQAPVECNASFLVTGLTLVYRFRSPPMAPFWFFVGF